MKGVFIGAAIAVMKALYIFMKLRKTRNRVVFLSRQADAPNLDFGLLAEALAEMDPAAPAVETVFLTRRIGTGARRLLYPFHILRQMSQLAVSRVAVLDSYCIPVSVLAGSHKKDLKVIQIWHAIGLMKKAGLAIVGKDDGRDEGIATSMRMHEGYDVILASSEACRSAMCEVFGYDDPDERAFVCPLPRVDALRSPDYAARKRDGILRAYPQLAEAAAQGRQTILYIPTQRADETLLQEKLDELTFAADKNGYTLVVKPHPLSHLNIDTDRAVADGRFPAMDWLFAADYVVCDYSSMIYEALIAGRPVCFYAFDFDAYNERRGWFIDYANEVPGRLCATGEEVIREIRDGDFDAEAAARFRDRYVEPARADGRSCSERLAREVSRLMGI
jgi:CDP-ribitol ribitolphosphotransferase